MAASRCVPETSRTTNWKLRLIWSAGALSVVLAAIGVRYFWSASSADAQTPRSARPASDMAAEGQQPAAAANSAGAPDAAQLAQAGARQLQVMALVNGEQIGRADLAQECLRRFGRETLETMVNRSLIQAACQAKNVTVSDAEIEGEVTTLAKRFGLSNDRWFELLQKERSITPEQYRRDLIWPTLALRKLTSTDIQVTREELAAALDAQYGPRAKVRLIALSSAKKAADVRASATTNPDDFGRLAKEFSEDKTSAAVGGLMPPIHKGGGNPELEQAALALKAGEISPVIKVANQYVILKCEQQLPAAGPLSAEERKSAETQATQTIRDKKLRGVANDLMKQLQDQAKIENVFNDPKRQKELPGVAAIVNGRQLATAALAEECLARHAREVLDGEINRRILLQALRARGGQVSEKEIDAEIERAARTYGYTARDGSADVERWLKRVQDEQGVTVELYVRDVVWPTVALKKLTGEVKVSDADLKKGFEANYGERVEVLVCVLNDQRTAQQVWEQARKNPTDEFFASLATQYSAEQLSKANGGRVPPIRMHGGQPAVEKEAFALKRGELSGIVAIGDKFIVMRCLGRTKPVVVDFAEVKDQLLEDLGEKQMRVSMTNKFEELRGGARFENFLTGEIHAPKVGGGSFGKQGPAVAPGVRESSGPVNPAAGGVRSPVIQAGATSPVAPPSAGAVPSRGDAGSSGLQPLPRR